MNSQWLESRYAASGRKMHALRSLGLNAPRTARIPALTDRSGKRISRSKSGKIVGDELGDWAIWSVVCRYSFTNRKSTNRVFSVP
jgi:hypothetical protein